MKLNELLKDIIDNDTIDNREITSISISSKEVKVDSLFIALTGTITDGHNFINEAIENGATVIVCEKTPQKQKNNVMYLQVESTKIITGLIASRFFGNPSHKMQVVGVTGTNGKTTTTTLLYDLFEKMGHKSGLISTIENRIHTKKIPTNHTTPNQITLQKIFKEMVDEGCEYCFIEVSSHALDQGRVIGVEFAGGIFSNATHDHLDYHVTFEEYLKVKRGMFELLHPHAWALVNADDENGAFMLQNTQAAKNFYGLQKEDGMFAGEINFEGTIAQDSFFGLVMNINGQKILSQLVGKFNAYNLLAIFGAAMLLQQDEKEIAEVIAELHSADGRFEVLRGKTGKIGIVDYAHTPDALENVLATINEIKKDDQKIITVIGCGGNRDTEKRPQMAFIAESLSDYVILTSDNPRHEDPLVIINEMKKGLRKPDNQQVFITPDRKEAIDTAVYTARDNDIILIAGKGHETYQEVKGNKFDFSDKEVLQEKLRKY